MSARGLWSAVVLQATTDVDTEHYSSVEYGQAVSFFLAPGLWAESRQNIADCLELHPDDLTRLGRAIIAARHLREPPPPVIEQVAATPRCSLPRPEPTLTNPVPVVPKAPVSTSPRVSKPPRFRVRAKLEPKAVRDRDWWIQRFLDKQAA